MVAARVFQALCAGGAGAEDDNHFWLEDGVI